MDPPCWAQFLQVVLFIHPWSELPPFLIASIMSNEREWIEHTLSHAHHEPRGAPPVSTPGLLCDSQQCRGTTGDPRTLLARSLARSLNPSFFPFPTLSLSLPSPFAHCHSANDDGRRGVGGGRGGGGGRTSQRPFRAWHIQCVRAACVGSLPSHARGAPFGSERSCVRFCFHVDRISSEQS